MGLGAKLRVRRFSDKLGQTSAMAKLGVSGRFVSISLPALGICSALAFSAGFVVAEDFTFRRIGVDTGSAGQRITVQIDPEEQARRIAPPDQQPAPQSVPRAEGTGASAPADARYAWFWDRVSPNIAQGEGRFLAAMAALRDASDGQRVPEPGVQHLQDIVARHGAQILGATVGTNVSPALALSVIAVESAGRTQAESHAGAQGLMQLIPATAERFGVENAMDPAQNIRGGVAYLDWLLGEFDRDVVLALAGYNAGEGAVRRNGGVPPYAETRDYVPKVLAAWNIARGLCATPVQLPTDPCVFAIQAVRSE